MPRQGLSATLEFAGGREPRLPAVRMSLRNSTISAPAVLSQGRPDVVIS